MARPVYTSIRHVKVDGRKFTVKYDALGPRLIKERVFRHKDPSYLSYYVDMNRWHRDHAEGRTGKTPDSLVRRVLAAAEAAV